MVPTDYRLEHVCVRLIDRLEGARRSFAGDRDKAGAEFRRIAGEMVDAAIGEYRAVAVEPPAEHAEFLQREVIDTFLPRYTRVAVDMTTREQRGYGVGFFANPAGRVVLVALAIAVAALEFRAGGARLGWIGVGLVAIVPFVPDILAALWRRRHQIELQEIVDDMAKIQSQADAYAGRRLGTEPVATSDVPRVQPTSNKEQR